MANVTKGLNKAVQSVGRGINAAKKQVDKVLWGYTNNVTTSPSPATSTQAATGLATPVVPTSSTTNPTAPASQPATPKKTKVGSFIQSGLFNVLDALLRVDLCNILNYLLTVGSQQIGQVKRSETPTPLERTLYDLQDKAALVRKAIDNFYAFPDRVLENLRNPNQATALQVEIPPTTSRTGTANQKYNFGILTNYIASVFQYGQAAATGVTEIAQQTLLEPEARAALSLIPGVNTNLNALQDFIGLTNRFADFRTISDAEFEQLVSKLDKIRSVCITIERFNLSTAVGVVQQFATSDIRSQIAELNQYFDVTKIIPTLKQINSSLTSFINTCRSLQNYLRLGRGFIKIAITLVRIYKFVAKLIAKNPTPLRFTTYSLVARFENAKEEAKKNNSELIEFLEQLNILMSIILNIIIYVQQNTQALLDRLRTLLIILQSCEATKDSPVVTQLATTQAALINLNRELEQTIASYKNKTQDNTFGAYTIQIVEEELVDEGIVNKRRRGIALGVGGIIAVQSDLTFATNDAIIIEEVKLKLAAAGLVSSELGETDLTIIESLKYLEDDNLDQSELTVETSLFDSGLNRYLDNSAQAKKVRKRVKDRIKAANLRAKQAIAREMANTSRFLGIINNRNP